MLRYLRLFGRFARVELQYELAYRVNLLLELIEMLVVIASSVGAVLVLFSYTTEMNGWSLSRMMVLLGVYYVVQGIQELIFSPSITRLMEHVRLGTLDFTLLKPADAQFMASLRHLEIVQVAQAVLGVAVVAVGLDRMGNSLTPGGGLAFALMLACGMVLVYSMLLVLATLSFWLVRIDNLMAIFWAFVDAGRFPVDIYPGWLRVTLATAVPIGVAVTFPAQAVVGALDTQAFFATVVGTAVAFLFARWFWQRGLMSYTGASA